MRNKLKAKNSQNCSLAKNKSIVGGKPRLGVYLLGGKVQKDLLEFGLSDQIVLDGEGGLVGFDQREGLGEGRGRVVVDVDVEEAVSVLFECAQLETGDDEADEAVDVVGLGDTVVVDQSDLGEESVALAVPVLQVLQAAQTLKLPVDHDSDVGAEGFCFIHAFLFFCFFISFHFTWTLDLKSNKSLYL